jgi:signal transduction histidine kinase
LLTKGGGYHTFCEKLGGLPSGAYQLSPVSVGDLMVRTRFRSRQFILLALFLLIVILLFNVGGWLLYDRVSRYLDDQLGQRLQAIAVTSTLDVSPYLLESVHEPGARFLLEDYLQQIKDNNHLEAVTLFDKEETILVSTSSLLEYGAQDPALTLDREAVALAASGVPSASYLYSVDGYYLKSGYAPITDDQGEVLAILGVEASAGHFRVLGNFKKTMLIIGGASLFFLMAVGLLFLKLSYSLAQAEIAVLRADALASLGRMAAHMAHEIRNPLSIIRGAVERLRASPAVQEADRELLGFLPEEVDRLDEIVSRYLDFARVEPPKLVAEDLAILVKETVAMAQRELADKGVNVVISSPPHLPPIRLDATRIKQALLNLLLNAVQAMPRGGEIHIGLSQLKKQVRLDLRDTGEGIPQSHLAKIFEPFYTTKEKGSGLGLAMVAKIVADHRGKIRVRSQPQGTTFSLFLPI